MAFILKALEVWELMDGWYQAESDKPFLRLADSNYLWAILHLLQLAGKPGAWGKQWEVSEYRLHLHEPAVGLPAVHRLESFLRIETFGMCEQGAERKMYD